MMKNNEQEQTGFVASIKYNGDIIPAKVRYSFPLTEEEKKIYRIEDGDFLVALNAPEGHKVFKVFLDEAEQWKTNSSEIIVDRELVEQIGQSIDSFLA